MSQLVDTEAPADAQASPPRAANDIPAWVWAVAPVLVVFYPGLLYQWVFGVHALRVALYLLMVLLVGAFTLVIWAALYFFAFKRDFRRSAGVATVIVVSFFSWPPWAAIGDAVAGLTRIGVLSDVVTVLVPVGLLWAAVKYADRDRFLVVLVGALVGVLIVLGYSMSTRVAGSDDVAVPASSAGPHPNVVVLVLDGYARADVLAEQYGFDNSAFLGALGDRGFSIRGDAVTNYSVTHTSLSSMMAAGYPFEEGARSEASMDRMRRLLSGDGALMHAFDAAGYETVMFENAWAGSNCGGTPDVCHRTGLLGRSFWSLGQMTPLAVIQRVSVPHPFTAIGLQHIRELGEILEEDSAEPVFVMAHVTVPHPPTQLTGACDFVVASDRLSMLLASADTAEADRATARGRYIDQMTCINGEVITTVDRLLASDEDLEMVIIADHGPDSHAQHAKEVADWTDDELLERLAVLSAVRMPQTCAEREPARTTVNTIRRSVGCALGIQLDDLPDRYFVAPAAQAIDEPIVDVTDRMNSISSRIGR